MRDKTRPASRRPFSPVRIFSLVVFIFISRLVAMAWIPLNDTTEARYGEIARLMLSENNWVTLMHYPNDYFWAKPPLSTWLSALSMKLFGVSAFFARLPAILLSLLCLGLLAQVAKQQWGKHGALWLIGILSTMTFFILDAGVVMTEPALITAVVIVMVSFWNALKKDAHPHWRYFVFVGFGLSLLAKGPVAGIFTLLPMIFWLTLTKQWRLAFKTLPVFKGTLLTLTIALPWYILAEIKTPGFLNYFIVGEHISRFLQPGWSGDLYGYVHHVPRGMIWIYFFLGSLPWSFVLFGLFCCKKTIVKTSADEQVELLYWSSFCFVPLVFFTFARNIIYPYIFPVLPAFAMIVTHFLIKNRAERWFFFTFKFWAYLLGSALIFASFLFQKIPQKILHAQALVAKAWLNQHPKPHEYLIYLREKPEYSAMFYTQGRARAVQTPQNLCELLQEGSQFIVIRSDNKTWLSRKISATFKAVETFPSRRYHDTLYRVKKIPPFCEPLPLDQ